MSVGGSESSKTKAIESAIFAIVQEVFRELHPRRPQLDISPETRLDMDLGIDSLGRAQLLSRLEARLGVRLPAEKILKSLTIRDLLEAAKVAGAPSPLSFSHHSIPHPPEPGLKQHQPALGAHSLVELLQFHASVYPDDVYLYLLGDGDEAQDYTYGDILSRVERVAAGLQSRLSSKNNTIAIMLPTGIDFFSAFFGILLAGHIPIPLYPPFRWNDIEEHLRRQIHILKNAETPLMITHPDALKLKNLLRGLCPTLKDMMTVEELSEAGSSLTRISPRETDIAFLQYTSGSTGDPKGVILTHQNLLANIRTMETTISARRDDIFVSWLPLYHDMGLIGACFATLHYGCPLVLMSPLTFLARPEKWLWAIHNYRGTLSASPNFGYERCLHSISESQIKGLDLSSWRMAFNGAETVHAGTIERFINRFRPYGFGEQVLTPVYGLAESSLGLTFPPLGRRAKIDLIDRKVLHEKRLASPALPNSEEILPLVSNGLPLPGHEIRIVDEHDRELPERQEGMVLFKGPSATSGYYRNPAATAKLIRGSWLNSGDRGYLAEGELFITGREKDLMIRGGRNLYPYELEAAVGNLSGIRKGCVAVFGVVDPLSATERIIVAAEKKEKSPERDPSLREQINALSVEILETPPDEILLTPPHSVPKTSSGKIRRSYCKELYEKGRLGRSIPPFLQIIHLGLQSLTSKISSLLSRATDLLYGIFAWIMWALFIPPLAIGLLILPGYHRRFSFSHHVSRFFFKVIALPLSVQGLQNLLQDPPCILISNHQSYLDWLILFAIAPRPFRFTSKGEFQQNFFFRFWMNRMKVLYVERFDPKKSLEDTENICETVKKGSTVLFFPEGTFFRPPGLLPFRLGAFQVATEARTSVIPIVIRGSRNALPETQWLLRRRAISVKILNPLHAQGNSWRDVLDLREAAYSQVLAECGEAPAQSN